MENQNLGQLQAQGPELVVNEASVERVIMIRPAENGCSIGIGCKTFVFNNIEEMMTEIKAYLLKQPTELNKKYVTF